MYGWASCRRIAGAIRADHAEEGPALGPRLYSSSISASATIPPSSSST